MQPWVSPFLDALRQTGNVAEAARTVGIHSSSAYALRAKDAEFAEAWANACEDATDAMELEARRRALAGVDEPVVYQGQLTPVWERDEFGDIVMEDHDTGLKKADGSPVMSMRGVQARHPDGSPVWLTVNKKSDPLLMFMLKGLRRKYGTDSHEITGKDGAPLAVMDETKKAARIAALLEIARSRKEDDFL